MAETISVRRPASARPRPAPVAAAPVQKVAPEEDDGIADDNETWSVLCDKSALLCSTNLACEPLLDRQHMRSRLLSAAPKLAEPVGSVCGG
jgi:hypothetical protein